ncbi:unnamed protein product [Clonostachys byssicola]|uniref:lytic cellulose monooxygenase (C4-dehydrogenating) n=1 Tax=Clonostachys byssicola TaxID=160290 RepID=A0A9N9UI37_9HYPO|nr:unnamed protein product [Clonostachys byssicola]
MAKMSTILKFTFVASLAQAHFTFVRLAHNGEWQAPTQFIRNKTEPFEERSTPNTNNNERLYNFPTFVSDYPESVRCGRDNMAHAANTEVLRVKAGDTIEIAHTRISPSDWADNQWYDCPNGRGSCDPNDPDWTMDFNHPGPLLAHLSKAPDGTDVREYDGSGEWVKIYSLGFDMNEDGSIHWLAYNYEKLPARFIFDIPKQTPAGEYLLRLDLIWPGLWEPPIYVSDTPQIYATCAQILVESDATGPLPEGIEIPADLNTTTPGMRTSLSMYRGESMDDGYTYPGGLLWTGEELVEDKPIL